MAALSSWWLLLHPDLTVKLLIIIVFLLLTAIGNGFGIYDNLANGNVPAALTSFFSLILYVVPAYGLLKLKNWARMFELGLSVILVIVGFIIMFTFDMTIGICIIVPHGLIAIYLLTNECRRAFGLT